MIIVTADDYGRSRHVTDSVLECYSNKLITSTSAMVFMEDSERAAPLALQAGIEIGLHINFTEPFNANDTSGSMKEHLGKVAAFLTKNKMGQALYNPRLAGSFKYLFKAQDDEFARKYGKRPEFYNGHHHMHLCANMILSRILPAGARIRRTFTFDRGQKSVFNLFYRRLLDFAVTRKFVSTDGFFSILPLHDDERLRRIFDRALMDDVEIEVHPENTDEMEFLLSERYLGLIKSARVGSFRELAGCD